MYLCDLSPEVCIRTTMQYMSKLEATDEKNVHVMTTDLAHQADHRLKPSPLLYIYQVGLELASETCCMHHQSHHHGPFCRNIPSLYTNERKAPPNTPTGEFWSNTVYSVVDKRVVDLKFVRDCFIVTACASASAS
jgi:hypothetical protein